MAARSFIDITDLQRSSVLHYSSQCKGSVLPSLSIYQPLPEWRLSLWGPQAAGRWQARATFDHLDLGSCIVLNKPDALVVLGLAVWHEGQRLIFSQIHLCSSGNRTIVSSYWQLWRCQGFLGLPLSGLAWHSFRIVASLGSAVLGITIWVAVECHFPRPIYRIRKPESITFFPYRVSAHKGIIAAKRSGLSRVTNIQAVWKRDKKSSHRGFWLDRAGSAGQQNKGMRKVISYQSRCNIASR